MSSRINVSGSSPYEAAVGYSRAVRAGNAVHVAGTAGWAAPGELAPGGAYEQAAAALRNIAEALERAGASMADVVRTRIYVVDIARDGEAAGRAHGEIFAGIRPACTMVEVAALIEPEMLVEIEAEALVDSPEA